METNLFFSLKFILPYIFFRIYLVCLFSTFTLPVTHCDGIFRANPGVVEAVILLVIIEQIKDQKHVIKKIKVGVSEIMRSRNITSKGKQIVDTTEPLKNFKPSFKVRNY